MKIKKNPRPVALEANLSVLGLLEEQGLRIAIALQTLNSPFSPNPTLLASAEWSVRSDFQVIIDPNRSGL